MNLTKRELKDTHQNRAHLPPLFESHEERIESEITNLSTVLSVQNLTKRELKVKMKTQVVEKVKERESHEERIESESLEKRSQLALRSCESHEERIESIAVNIDHLAVNVESHEERIERVIFTMCSSSRPPEESHEERIER